MIYTCEGCKKEFKAHPSDIKKGRKLCSWECRYSKTIEIKTKCKNCGKVFTYKKRPSDPKKSFCSKPCADTIVKRYKGKLRKCAKCKKFYKLDHFMKGKCRDGFSSICKECNAIKMAKTRYGQYWAVQRGIVNIEKILKEKKQ